MPLEEIFADLHLKLENDFSDLNDKTKGIAELFDMNKALKVPLP